MQGESVEVGRVQPQTVTAAGDRLAFACLLAFFVCMYAVPQEWIPALQGTQPAFLLMVITAVLLLLSLLGLRRRLLVDGGRGLLLLTFVALAFASTAWSIQPEATQVTATDLLKWAVVYLLTINLVTTRARLRATCLGLVLASILVSNGVIEWHRAGVDMVEGFRARWVGMYADPNRMAMSLQLIVPLALALALRKRSPGLVRVLCAVAAVLAVTAMIFSYSRGGFLGLATSLFVWTLLERKPWQMVAVVVVATGMLVLAPEDFWERNQTVTSFAEDASAMSRVHAWMVTAEVSRDRPILGTGAGTFMAAWTAYAPAGVPPRAYMAHNIFLQTVAELGLAGFAIFLCFTSAAIGRLLPLARGPEFQLERALLAAAAGHLVCCLFSGFLGTVHYYVLLALVACAERLARAPARDAAGAVPAQTSPPARLSTG